MTVLALYIPGEHAVEPFSRSFHLLIFLEESRQIVKQTAIYNLALYLQAKKLRAVKQDSGWGLTFLALRELTTGA